MDFDQMHRHIIGRGEKKLLDFGDLDLIFKVTPVQIFTKKACLHPISRTK